MDHHNPYRHSDRYEGNLPSFPPERTQGSREGPYDWQREHPGLHDRRPFSVGRRGAIDMGVTEPPRYMPEEASDKYGYDHYDDGVHYNYTRFPRRIPGDRNQEHPFQRSGRPESPTHGMRERLPPRFERSGRYAQDAGDYSRAPSPEGRQGTGFSQNFHPMNRERSITPTGPRQGRDFAVDDEDFVPRFGPRSRGAPQSRQGPSFPSFGNRNRFDDNGFMRRDC